MADGELRPSQPFLWPRKPFLWPRKQQPAVMALLATRAFKFSPYIVFYCFHLVAFVRPELKEALEKSPEEQEDESPLDQPVQKPKEDELPVN